METIIIIIMIITIIMIIMIIMIFMIIIVIVMIIVIAIIVEIRGRHFYHTDYCNGSPETWLLIYYSVLLRGKDGLSHSSRGWQ